MGAMHDRGIVLLSKHAGTPRESWWLTLPREGFTQRAEEEGQRMKTSKFGSMQLGTSAADAKIARRRQLPV